MTSFGAAGEKMIEQIVAVTVSDAAAISLTGFLCELITSSESQATFYLRDHIDFKSIASFL